MIYYLEDDDSIRELVIYTLTHSNLEAKGFAHPREFWKAMEEQKAILAEIQQAFKDIRDAEE